MLDLRQILESKTIVYWSSDPFLWLGIWPKKGLWIQFCLCVTSHVLVNPFAFGIQALNFSQDYFVVSWWTWSSKLWTKIKLQHLQLILSYIMSSISSLLHQEDVDIVLLRARWWSRFFLSLFPRLASSYLFSTQLGFTARCLWFRMIQEPITRHADQVISCKSPNQETP